MAYNLQERHVDGFVSRKSFIGDSQVKTKAMLSYCLLSTESNRKTPPKGKLLSDDARYLRSSGEVKQYLHPVQRCSTYSITLNTATSHRTHSRSKTARTPTNCRAQMIKVSD